MQSLFFKIFSIKKEELWLLIWSVVFIFLLFASYAILRPLRDALALEGKISDIKWLFLASFVAILIASFASMWLASYLKRKNYLNIIYLFFSLNLIIIYIAMRLVDIHDEAFISLARIFYVWVSVFNLFVISSAWSLLADIFEVDSSKRLFGIIAAGASLGAIAGASIVKVLSNIGENLILLSIVFLLLALGVKWLLMHLAYRLSANKTEFKARFSSSIGAKNPLSGFALIMKSRFLLAFLAFILLLTSVSTFLYMEQARIIKETFSSREARIAAFGYIDLVVQSASFIIQIFLTAKIAKIFGLKWLLGMLGFVIGFGFIGLIFTHPLFLPFVVVMCLRRIGEYALIKPGREMLFVPLDSDSKYKVKNFFDTVVYRGGDALSVQLEALLARVSILAALLVGALISFMWGMLGVYLAKKYEKMIDD